MFIIKKCIKIKKDGIYRCLDAKETIDKATFALKKKYKDVFINNTIDHGDNGLSKKYKRSEVLVNGSVVGWGKGTCLENTVASALMEAIEILSIDENRNPLIQKLFEYSMNNDLDAFFTLISKNLDFYETYFYIDASGSYMETKLNISLIASSFIGNNTISGNTIGFETNRITDGFGDGAGNTLEEAILHSMLEILEYLCEDSILRKKNIPPQIIIDTPTKETKKLLKHFKDCGFDNISFSDWSCGFGYPVIAITCLFEGELYYKVGTGTNKDEAIIRALTEFIQTFGKTITSLDKTELLSQLRTFNDFSTVGEIKFSEICSQEEDDISLEIINLNKKFSDFGITYFFKEYTDEFLKIPVCRGIIASDLFLNSKKLDTVSIDAADEIYVVHVTKRCNLNCVYCYEKDKKSEYTLAEIFSFIDGLVKNRTSDYFKIEFLGGEPLLEFNKIKSCYEYIKKNYGFLKINYTITTNGTLIDEEIISFLKENPDFKTSISLDGHMLSNQLRLDHFGKNCYNSVIEKCSLLLKSGVYFSVHLVVHHYNVGFLKDSIEHLYNIGIKNIDPGIVEGDYELNYEFANEMISQLKGISDKIKTGVFNDLNVSLFNSLKPSSDIRTYLYDDSGKLIGESYGRSGDDYTKKHKKENVKFCDQKTNNSEIIDFIRTSVFNYHLENKKGRKI